LERVPVGVVERLLDAPFVGVVVEAEDRPALEALGRHHHHRAVRPEADAARDDRLQAPFEVRRQALEIDPHAGTLSAQPPGD